MIVTNTSPILDFAEDPQILDRRAHERFPAKLQAICETADEKGEAHFCTVVVISLSSHGSGCIAPRFFERGKKLRLGFANASGTIWHSRFVRVMHGRPFGANSWMMGCEFLTPLEDTQVRELLGEQ